MQNAAFGTYRVVPGAVYVVRSGPSAASFLSRRRTHISGNRSGVPLSQLLRYEENEKGNDRGGPHLDSQTLTNRTAQRPREEPERPAETVRVQLTTFDDRPPRHPPMRSAGLANTTIAYVPGVRVRRPGDPIYRRGRMLSLYHTRTYRRRRISTFERRRQASVGAEGSSHVSVSVYADRSQYHRSFPCAGGVLAV